MSHISVRLRWIIGITAGVLAVLIAVLIISNADFRKAKRLMFNDFRNNGASILSYSIGDYSAAKASNAKNNIVNTKRQRFHNDGKNLVLVGSVIVPDAKLVYAGFFTNCSVRVANSDTLRLKLVGGGVEAYGFCELTKGTGRDVLRVWFFDDAIGAGSDYQIEAYYMVDGVESLLAVFPL